MMHKMSHLCSWRMLKFNKVLSAFCRFENNQTVTIMKKVLLGLFVVGFALTSCEKDVTNNSENLNYKKGDKVVLCHMDDQGNYNSISVSPQGAATHLAHGDTYANPDGSCGCSSSYLQDFSVDAKGWYSSYGGAPVDRRGSFFGYIYTPYINAGVSGPYTYFDDSIAPYQYRSIWPSGGWYTEIDIFLTGNWAHGEGFDYSVAASNQNGSHLRDYIFHVGRTPNNGLVINASNNTDFAYNEYKLLTENGGAFYSLPPGSGWYTFRHVFYDNGGVLACDMQVIDSNGTLVWSVTRSNPADLIGTVVGGSRYGWFTHIDLNFSDEALVIDNVEIHRGCQP